MSWLALLLTLTSLGGSPAPGAAKPKAHCAAHAKHCKTAKPKPKAKPKKTPQAKSKQPAPQAQPAPGNDTPTANPSPRADPTPTPTPKPGVTPTPTPPPTDTPVPTPTPVYPKRTGVDLVEYDVRAAYHTLAAGRVSFTITDLGEDDHNLSVRGGGKEYGGIDLSPGDTSGFAVTLPPGTYTLYCNLNGHEALGMSTDITVY